MDDTSPTLPTKERSSNTREPPVAHLACEPCKKRKVKCDREYPVCSTCRMFNRECVAVVRPRLPRGRKGGRKEASSELRARVNRLESLVQSLSKHAPSGADIIAAEHATQPVRRSTQLSSSASPPALSANNSSSAESPSALDSSSRRTSKTSPLSESGVDTSRYLGASLWETLSQEVDGIRAILAEPDENDELEAAGESDAALVPTEPNATLGTDLLGFANSLSHNLPEPGSHAAKTYLTLLALHVDPVVRLAYLPSMRKHLETGAPYLDYSLQSPKLRALKAAIFYACICSVDDDFCLASFGTTQSVLKTMWKSTTEASLRQADFLTSKDLATLQALIIYIYCIRTVDSSGTCWTLLALAVRISQSMGLHREDTYSSMTFFQAQMARRTFYRVLDQDLQFAVDRGSDVLIYDDDSDTKRPLNINDADMPPDRVDPCEERLGFTENSHVVVCAELAFAVRKLNWVPPGSARRACNDARDTWESRFQDLSDYKLFLRRIIVPGKPIKTPFEDDVANLARMICSEMYLWFVRPLQRHPNLPPPPYPSSTIMTLAMKTLENYVNIAVVQYEGGAYRWCSSGYVPWHPFAILVAELCCDHEPDLIARGWSIVDRVQYRLSMRVAEGPNGTLWAPIKKLLRKAEMKRPQNLPRMSTETHPTGFPANLDSNTVADATGQDIDMPTFDAAGAEWNSPLSGQNLLPSPDTQWQTAPQSEPSWGEWSMFVDGLYSAQAPSADMWMTQADQQTLASMSLNGNAATQETIEPTIYPWAA